VDTQSAGALNAAQNLLNVVNVLLLGVISFAIPTARRKLIEFGYAVWRRWLLQVGFILVSISASVAVTMATFAKPLLAFVYTPFYAEYAFLMPVLAVYYCLLAANMVLSAAFNTARLPHVGFVAKSISAVLTLVISYPLLQKWGVMGAAVGLSATQAFWTLIYLIYVAKGALRPEKVEASARS
jgi:O-antigen/teichoic acid export membrane protein